MDADLNMAAICLYLLWCIMILLEEIFLFADLVYSQGEHDQ